MSNPKTTIAGYLLVAASVLTLAAHALTGELGTGDLSLVLSALTGLGLIAAKDGGR